MKNVIKAALCLLFATGCQKQSSVTEQSQAHEAVAVQMSAASENTQPGNAVNPYDSAGYWHNQGLSFVYSKMSGTTDTIVAIRSAAVAFGQQILHVNILPETLASLADRVINDATNNYANIIEQMPYPANVKHSLRALIMLIDSARKTNVDYSDLKYKLTDFETGIMQDKSLGQAGLQILLGAASVGRYSVYYWTNHPQPAQARRFNIVRAFVLGLADLVAFATSSAAGGDGTGLQGVVTEAADVSAEGARALNYSPLRFLQ